MKGPVPAGHGLACHNHSAESLGECDGVDLLRRSLPPSARRFRQILRHHEIENRRRLLAESKEVVQTIKVGRAYAIATLSAQDAGILARVGLTPDQVKALAAKFQVEHKERKEL